MNPGPVRGRKFIWTLVHLFGRLRLVTSLSCSSTLILKLNPSDDAQSDDARQVIVTDTLGGGRVCVALKWLDFEIAEGVEQTGRAARPYVKCPPDDCGVKYESSNSRAGREEEKGGLTQRRKGAKKSLRVD